MLFDYVVAEVLDRLPDDERDAVLALSLLDDIDGRALHRDDRQRRTATSCCDGCSRRGLPLMPLDAQQQTVRFHQLFRDLVFNELKLRRADDLPALHRRAAEAEQAAGDMPAAVRHYLAAGRHRRRVRARRDTGVGSLPGRTDQRGSRLVGAVPRGVRRRGSGSDPELRGRAQLRRPARRGAPAGTNGRPPGVPDDVALSSELTISWMLVHLGRADTAAVRADFEQLERLRPGRCFDWDPANRVITIMAIAALVDEDLDEAEHLGGGDRGRDVEARAGRASSAAPLARHGWRSSVGRWPTPSGSPTRPVARGSRLASVEATPWSRCSPSRPGWPRSDASADEADAWAERAVDLAAELGDPLPPGHRPRGHRRRHRGPRRCGGGVATARADDRRRPSSRQLGTRHALLAAELEARCGAIDDAERAIPALPAGLGERSLAAIASRMDAVSSAERRRSARRPIGRGR